MEPEYRRKSYDIAISVNQSLLRTLEVCYELHESLKSESEKEAILNVAASLKALTREIQPFIDVESHKETNKKTSSKADKDDFIEGLMSGSKRKK